MLPHAVTTWNLKLERVAVDKLAAKEILVIYVKAAEDFDLPILATASTLGTCLMLHAPHQPSKSTVVKLCVFFVRWRKPKASKPIAMKVVQISSYLFAEIFQRWMFLDLF